MKFEIYNGKIHDSFIVEHETREECEKLAEVEMNTRRWDPDDTCAMEVKGNGC